MLKIVQARLQQYMNHELPDVQAGFRKGSKPRDQIVNIRWIIGKAREFQKKSPSTSALLTALKPLTVWITTNWKILQDMEVPEHLTYLLQKLYAGRTRCGKQTSSRLGKEYVKAAYCHSTYLTFMQSTSWKMPGWMKHKLESRLPGEISITSDM